jgi:hypothetical protein
MLDGMGIRIFRLPAEKIEGFALDVGIDILASFRLLSPSSGISRERGPGGEEGN